MAFSGPELSDYENVVSLNAAWLSLLQQDNRLRDGLAGLPDAHRRRMTTLGVQQVARLAATPFLLFSFREGDEAYWNRVLAGNPEQDLFRETATDDVETLVSASLGFIWQLARRNPYSLRLICGATLYWTERIAEQTFYELLHAVRTIGDTPDVRFAEESALWRKLLDSGVSPDRRLRHAAQMSALQAILTSPPDRRTTRWSLAARTAQAPRLCVAEKNEARKD